MDKEIERLALEGLQSLADTGFSVVDLSRTPNPLPRKEISATSVGGYIHILPAKSDDFRITLSHQKSEEKRGFNIQYLKITERFIDMGINFNEGGYWPYIVFPLRDLNISDMQPSSRSSREYFLDQILNHSQTFKFDEQSRLFTPA